MQNFPDIFDTRKRSFISGFSICMTVTLRNIDMALVSLLSTLKRFHTFLSISFLTFGNCCQLGFPADIKVQTSKNHKTCKERCKLCHIKQTDQTARRKETSLKFVKYAECSLWANIYRIYWCLELYLINTFTKSAKAERCTDITLKLTLIVYLLLSKI